MSLRGEDPSPDPPPFGLDAGARRALTLCCLAFAVLHLLFLAALLLPGTVDRRWLAAGVLVLFACCALSAERLLTGHPRAALLMAALPAGACLLFDAYAFAGGPGRG